MEVVIFPLIGACCAIVTKLIYESGRASAFREMQNAFHVKPK